jgi:predicted Co/Zn/Cd cation transporter (cation efflux family)
MASEMIEVKSEGKIKEKSKKQIKEKSKKKIKEKSEDSIKKEVKKIRVSALIASAITLVFIILKIFRIINLECTIIYLDPWQLFFSCELFYLSHYVLVFASSYLIVFFVLKRIFK